MSKYVVSSSALVNVIGMYDYAMHCNRKTFNEQATDVAARMFMLADVLPGMAATHLKMVAENDGSVTVEADEKAKTMTFTVKVDEHDQS